jgi:hypothetical protein
VTGHFVNDDTKPHIGERLLGIAGLTVGFAIWAVLIGICTAAASVCVALSIAVLRWACS